ncbi:MULTISPECIES: RNA-binding S4 domain-containing protein [Leisingera]|jgi:ribosome-associated heat shock protein Hsp15|uniref:RNA-binding S4 domain-containing protein n=1 Tax=Leisingera aquaemixtae TaxID=1396826 RepID=A0ABY5WFU3_9RHOB|nr:MULTISPECIES: RNA-binding S4 domain-containing protein [Leisingera]QDI75210.1 RNA-binding S4 domain-containing protein [Leisingera aquaemixtae]UWQ40315.1 RNA-binding S4 domain-containing protein [Leisingera aquaemixtae]UWQ44568.1 RNA-binding S4 domain-containing protein [Leisingera aquaemixtae]
MADGAPRIRIDKWLWYARFFKTRSLAAKQVGAGHVRVNGTKASKPAQNVSPGDVLTFAQGKVIRVVRIEATGERRGPAPEAQALYSDMTEKQEKIPANPKFEGKGRPDKKARRALDLTRKQDTL